MVPCYIAANPTIEMVYVTSESEDIVHVFDRNTNEFVTIINFEDNPSKETVNPITNIIYVKTLESNTVSIIDGSSNKTIDSSIIKEFLKNNDSGRFFQKQKSNIVTGCTHSNLMDIGVVLQ